MVADDVERLSAAQQRALSVVRGLACSEAPRARRTLAATSKRSPDITSSILDEVMTLIRDRARVVLHFHPDRISTNGRTAARGLFEDGVYRSQFETGLSNGSLTAFPGGQRDGWEKALFEGAYHVAGVPLGERPKYGSLELVRHADGPSPRFGSCYLVLRQKISQRCSFTFGGSQSPLVLSHSGTLDAFDSVLAALLETTLQSTCVLGLDSPTITTLLARISRDLVADYQGPSGLTLGRSLDSFIEAQVHGPVELERDVEWLVADAAFARTPIATQLQDIAGRYDIPLAWHAGFELAVDAVPSDFRGPAMPPLARRVAPDGVVDIAKIGAAAAALHHTPEVWADWGSRAETLQHLKQLWHVLVQYGEPVRREI